MNYNQKKKKKTHQLNLQPKNVIILRLSSKKSYLQHNKISSKATVISDINIPIPDFLSYCHTFQNLQKLWASPSPWPTSSIFKRNTYYPMTVLKSIFIFPFCQSKFTIRCSRGLVPGGEEGEGVLVPDYKPQHSYTSSSAR